MTWSILRPDGLAEISDSRGRLYMNHVRQLFPRVFLNDLPKITPPFFLDSSLYNLIRLHLVCDGSHDNAFGTVLVLVGSVVVRPRETREHTG